VQQPQQELEELVTLALGKAELSLDLEPLPF